MKMHIGQTNRRTKIKRDKRQREKSTFMLLIYTKTIPRDLTTQKIDSVNKAFENASK